MELQKDVIHGTWDYPFQVHRTKLDDGLQLYPHVHAEIEITCITRGTGTFCVNGCDYSVEEGDIVLIPADYIHLAYSQNRLPASFFSIVFSPECFNKDNRVYTKYFEPYINRIIKLPELWDHSCPDYDQIFLLASEIDAAFRQEGSELICQACLLKLWDLFFKYRTETDTDRQSYGNRLKESIDYMHSNLQNHILIKEPAELAHMSEGHFARVFKEYMKMSPVEYLLHIRIRESMRLLSLSDMPVGEVSLNCGFNDFSYFGKQFKKETGMTPRDYRRKYGNRRNENVK